MIVIIEKIHELLRSELPRGSIKEFYIGKPDSLSNLTMPCIATYVDSSESTTEMTGHDTELTTLIMSFYFPKKKGIANQHSKGTVGGYDKFMDLLGKLNIANQVITRTPDSILGVLRKHYTLLGTTPNTGNSIVHNNELRYRVDEPDENRMYYRALIEIKLTYFIRQDGRL
jgi:hypothetical protein